ncbi:MAG: TIGR03067 domain-containing protein [Planctomycetaceae bacterium]
MIALSRLDIKGKWPTFMEIPALDSEKAAYEKAYAKVRDQLLADQFDLKAVLEMDRTLDALKAKVMSAVPAERNYRAQALKFVDDLKDSTRLFDAGTVDYAKDILTDTKNGDATTVAELVSFMLKYRLQFATAERSSTARELYPKLYEALRQQAKELGIKPPEVIKLSDEEVTANKVKAMQGNWLCIAEEEVGQTLDATAVKERDRRLTIKGNNFTSIRTIANKRGSYDGKFEVSASNANFEFVGKGPGGGLVEWIGIYELDGDTLKLSFRYKKNDNVMRPTKFKTDGDRPNLSVFHTFKRVK